jgi:hypothetical protein
MDVEKVSAQTTMSQKSPGGGEKRREVIEFGNTKERLEDSYSTRLFAPNTVC